MDAFCIIYTPEHPIPSLNVYSTWLLLADPLSTNSAIAPKINAFLSEISIHGPVNWCEPL
jgi:hypothetical protein